MRVLYVYCHPLDDSFHAAIRKEALAALQGAGHMVDLLDLYAPDRKNSSPPPAHRGASRSAGRTPDSCSFSWWSRTYTLPSSGTSTRRPSTTTWSTLAWTSPSRP